MTRARVIRVAPVLAIATAALAVPMLTSQAHDVGVRSDAAPTSLGTAPRAAFAPAQPRLLSPGLPHRWAIVIHPVAALRSPGGAPAATLSTRSPEGTPNAVLVIGSIRRATVEWVHIRLPVLPNNTTGWVRRSALGGYHFVATHLVVDLRHLRATLFRSGRVVFSAPVGIGQPQYPTPRGQFYIRDELTDYASPFYGPVAFGTSARSAVLTEWPDGGFIGIHGTDEPQLIPGRVSHGCIRMRNQDILRLARLMPVGTPLTIS